MAQPVTAPRIRGESQAHAQLKRAVILWAQRQGFSACAAEVTLPQCRYRADVAAYRPQSGVMAATAIFECKQTLPDLRRDNCFSESARQRLEAVFRRRQVLEKHLRIHYPTLRQGDSLFPEFDSHDFGAIEHRSYTRVVRELTALQNRLCGSLKFEKLTRYRCANLFYLVLPHQLFREPEIPDGWGALIAEKDQVSVARRPKWHETTPECHHRFLLRIAVAGTRGLNRQLKIKFDDLLAAQKQTF